jgi:hypothetical protein
MNQSIVPVLLAIVTAALSLMAAGCSPPGTDQRHKYESPEPVRVLKPEDVKITLGKAPASEEAAAPESDAASAADAEPAAESTDTP